MNQNRWLSPSLYAITADTIDGFRGTNGANRSADVFESTVDVAVICWSWWRDDEPKSMALSLSPSLYAITIDTIDGSRGDDDENRSAYVIKSTVDVAAAIAADTSDEFKPQ